MATRIRLRRMGRKKHPTYRIVVADIAAPRDGKYIEAIGHYEPKESPAIIDVDRDKALKWLGEGATPSETVRSLLKKAGVFGPAPEAPAATVAPAGEATAATSSEETAAPAAPADDAPGDAEAPEEPAEN